MTRRKVSLRMLLTLAASIPLALPGCTQEASDPATLAFCKEARAQALQGALRLMLDQKNKVIMQDALAKACWKVPPAEADPQCEAANAYWVKLGGRSHPAPELEAGLAACRKAIDSCYKQTIELAAAERSSATEIRSCLQKAAFVGMVEVRNQVDDKRRANPDGDFVRLNASEVAAVEAAFAKAFAGISPITQDIMRAKDPMFLTFQTGGLIGEEHLSAIRKLSHPKSHYFVKQKTESVINQTDAEGQKDNRSWDVTFFIDKTGKARLIVPIGYLPKPYSIISAYVVTGSGDKSIVMEAVPVGKGLFAMDDPGPFQQILFHGEEKLTAANQLYLLRGTPELEQRLKFFDALRSALPKG